MRRGIRRLFWAGLAGVLALGACSANEPSESSSGNDGSSGAYKIGFLLPETAVARYEGKDKPYFEAKLKQLCPSCELLYANANSNAATQQQQAQSMLTQGVHVLVVDPLDGVAAASIVSAAKAKNVPVVAYDRLIRSQDLAYVISNDYEKVGELQAQALVDKLKADNVPVSAGGILMMNGATTDHNAGNIKKGAEKIIKASGYQVLASIDTWDPAAAQSWMSGQITRFGKKIVGVYSANDGNAGGAIAAFKAAGITPIPPITGLDASLAGLQAILAGDQYMTVYNAFKKEAETAATVAYELAQGKTPTAEATVEGIPAALNPPVAVTRDTIKSTVIADGFFTAAELCTAPYQQACTSLGIQ
ncbi:MAG: substrate-binding domain-containing protein [Micromonosporaceae bacterium]|jgi:D-xylose transport system substrate-binding protein|nr:substrate-binding domain-containing protein [Micromonosporaceae bacterium]